MNYHSLSIAGSSYYPDYPLSQNKLHGGEAVCHLYAVFLCSVRVLGISCPFFIQKLSLWGVWAVVRLHCSVTGLLEVSADRMV